jgi:hypothetical protein
MKKGDRRDLEKCTHPVPRNKFGIMAIHSLQNRAMSQSDLKKIIEGPIALVHKDIDRELAKVADERAMPPDV